MSANAREKVIALSTSAQSAIDTAAGSYWSTTEVGPEFVKRRFIVEDDADEYGKGHEFAENTYPSHWEAERSLDFYLCAETLAWACAYGLGSGTGSVFNPINPVTSAFDIELPYATLVEGIRPAAASPVLDAAYLGMGVDSFKIMVKSGPGRANSKLEVNLVGTGKFTEPSGITIPARTTVNLLPSASLTCTINGIDYVTSKNFVSWDFEWQNNIRKETNFFPGSGFQTAGQPATGAVAGRMEFGDRKLMSKLVARFDANSTEYALLTAQTAGTLAIGLSGTNSTSAAIAMPQIRFKTTELGNADGIVTVEVEHSVQVPAGQTVADLVTFTISHGLGTLGRS